MSIRRHSALVALTIVLLAIAIGTSPITAGSSPSRSSRDEHQLEAWTLGAAGSQGQAPGIVVRGTLGQTSVIGRGASPECGLLSGFWAVFLASPATTAAEDELPARDRLYAPAPNPFNPTTELAFAAATPGRARLLIFDLRGRLVRRLVDAEVPAGIHRARWDGRDDRGGTVASGTYVCQFTLGQQAQVVKLTLVK